MRPTLIILHHSATKDSGTVSWQAIRRFHTQANGWHDIGYHYGLEMIGDECEVLTGRPLDTPGAHTKGQNQHSIGICCVGNYDETDVPEVMLAKLIPLVRSLMRTFSIGMAGIKRHADFAPKTCPGTRFPMQALMSALSRELNIHVPPKAEGYAP